MNVSRLETFRNNEVLGCIPPLTLAFLFLSGWISTSLWRLSTSAWVPTSSRLSSSCRLPSSCRLSSYSRLPSSCRLPPCCRLSSYSGLPPYSGLPYSGLPYSGLPPYSRLPTTTWASISPWRTATYLFLSNWALLSLPCWWLSCLRR